MSAVRQCHGRVRAAVTSHHLIIVNSQSGQGVCPAALQWTPGAPGHHQHY